MTNPTPADQFNSAYCELVACGFDPACSTPQRFARWFWNCEEDGRFDIGCPDFPDRPALIYGVTALRYLCSVEHEAALELLRMTIAEIESTWPTTNGEPVR